MFICISKQFEQMLVKVICAFVSFSMQYKYGQCGYTELGAWVGHFSRCQQVLACFNTLVYLGTRNIHNTGNKIKK